MTLRVLIVTGTRRGRADVDYILTPHIQASDLVIHGGASGVDSQADALAKVLNVHTARIDALWKTRYKGAGHIRNGLMALLGYLLSQSGATVQCIALPDAQSIGTHNMVKQLRGVGFEPMVL